MTSIIPRAQGGMHVNFKYFDDLKVNN
jgi:hypothetical protein